MCPRYDFFFGNPETQMYSSTYYNQRGIAGTAFGWYWVGAAALGQGGGLLDILTYLRQCQGKQPGQPPHPASAPPSLGKGGTSTNSFSAPGVAARQRQTSASVAPQSSTCLPPCCAGPVHGRLQVHVQDPH
jgi:hypothetical protein